MALCTRELLHGAHFGGPVEVACGKRPTLQSEDHSTWHQMMPHNSRELPAARLSLSSNDNRLANLHMHTSNEDFTALDNL
eukprot:6478494-Amphidinium_carterae.1